MKGKPRGRFSGKVFLGSQATCQSTGFGRRDATCAQSAGPDRENLGAEKGGGKAEAKVRNLRQHEEERNCKEVAMVAFDSCPQSADLPTSESGL